MPVLQQQQYMTHRNMASSTTPTKAPPTAMIMVAVIAVDYGHEKRVEERKVDFSD